MSLKPRSHFALRTSPYVERACVDAHTAKLQLANITSVRTYRPALQSIFYTKPTWGYLILSKQNSKCVV